MTSLTPKTDINERLLLPFASKGIDSFSEEAQQLLRKRKILDFYILPGKVTAKIQDENTKMHLLEVRLQEIENEKWTALTKKLAHKAIFTSYLLNGEISEEICGILEELEIFPASASQYQLFYDYQETNELNLNLTCLLIKLSEKIQEDPFSLFLLRGKGKDEILLEIKRQREFLFRGKRMEEDKKTIQHSRSLDLDSKQIENFWKHGSELLNLSYSLRADDLPAAILKRLDSLPLNGFEEEADKILEEAYAYITTRAQAYGLGLK